MQIEQLSNDLAEILRYIDAIREEQEELEFEYQVLDKKRRKFEERINKAQKKVANLREKLATYES